MQRFLGGVVFAWWAFFGDADAMVSTAFADDCVTVLYPEVQEPYREVFRGIIEGIEKSSTWPVRSVSLGGISPDQLRALLENGACRALVGLGREGQKAVIGAKAPVVVAAVNAQPGETVTEPTFTLVPDPRELFVRLKHFMPTVTTVTAVYNPANSAELIKRAEAVAREFGLRIASYAASDLGAALERYETFAKEANSSTDALWLMNDSTVVNADAVLPLLLKAAWARRLAIFANNPSFVQRGVLFALYPFPQALGKRIAETVMACAQKQCLEPKVLLLRDVLTAVNTRAADQLEIRLGDGPYVDLIFPQR